MDQDKLCPRCRIREHCTPDDLCAICSDRVDALGPTDPFYAPPESKICMLLRKQRELARDLEPLAIRRRQLREAAPSTRLRFDGGYAVFEPEYTPEQKQAMAVIEEMEEYIKAQVWNSP